MARVEIIVNGVAYPCKPTMGAMLRFKKETGKEVTELTGDNFSDLCVYLYCCVVSACAAEKIGFELSLMEFADALSPEDMQAWTERLQSDAGDSKKKRKKP